MSKRGKLIAFEGGDGNGKSTQSKLLAERLNGVHTRQAGGTPLGERIRALTLHPDTEHVSDRAEALLYMADRAEHVDQVIEPALAAGRHVVTDRYAYSSLAYQGFGKGLDVDELKGLADWAMSGVWPDLVLLVEVPPEEGAERRAGRDGEVDHYEAAGLEFQRRVLDGYRRLAEAEPERWRTIDGRGTIDEVAERVWEAVAPVVAD